MEQIMNSLKNPEVLARLQREFEVEIIEDRKLEEKRIAERQERFFPTRSPRHINPTKVNTTVRQAVHRVCVPRMGMRSGG